MWNRRHSCTAPLLLTAGLLVTACSNASPPVELGSIGFPTSARGAAQEHFERGVLYLHSFEYSPAADAFRSAQEEDSTFAMAYWGEAMTYNHPVWNEQDLDAARTTLNRLASTPEQRADRAVTDREKAYLAAVEILYGDGSKERRDTLYADAMGRLVAAYPDDPEARAFYALALLGLSQGDRNIPTYMRAGAVAQEVFDRNRNHPGAAHYIIHSFDDPIHAPLGLAAARAYSAIAPGAAHAQHMTSHIFVAIGMWDDVVAANERAAGVVNIGLDAAYECGHYNEWLEYGYLQQGRIQRAGALLQDCLGDARRTDIARSPATSYAYMRALYIVDSQDWDGNVVRENLDGHEMAPRTRMLMSFGTGYAAAQRGDTDAAQTALRALEASSAGPENNRIMQGMIRALIARDRGNPSAAVRELREAADLEESLPFAFGPPATAKPARELLADVLLEMRRYDDAFVAYSRALTRTPLRAQTLLGIARAADAIGRTDYAADRLAELRAIWRGADAEVLSRFENNRIATASSEGQ